MTDLPQDQCTPTLMIDEFNPQSRDSLDPLLRLLRCERDVLDERQAFSVLHVGESQAQISEVLAAVRPLASSAPRSGHIGDWTAIAGGYAGALDFNQVVVANGYGHASVHALTMTETDVDGDRTYCPASVSCHGTKSALPLFSWNGRTFESKPGLSLFAPFTMTRWEGRSIPLVALHKSRMVRHSQFRFQYEAETLLTFERELVDGLTALLAAAVKAQSTQLLKCIVSSLVLLDGRMFDEPLVWDGAEFRAGNHSIGQIEHLVEKIVRLLHAVRDPDRFFSNIGRMPQVMPVISTYALTLFTALFTGLNANGTRNKVHLHWGARDMAGFPPYRKGYLCQSGTLRRLDRMTKVLLEHFIWAAPLKIILLPAAVFMLAPPSGYPADQILLSELADCIARTSDSPCALGAASDLTRIWFNDNHGRLSPYFVSRFTKHSGLFSHHQTEAHGTSVLPTAVASLPMNMACVLIGALHDAMKGVA